MGGLQARDAKNITLSPRVQGWSFKACGARRALGDKISLKSSWSFNVLAVYRVFLYSSLSSVITLQRPMTHPLRFRLLLAGVCRYFRSFCHVYANARCFSTPDFLRSLRSNRSREHQESSEHCSEARVLYLIRVLHSCVHGAYWSWVPSMVAMILHAFHFTYT